MISKVLLRKYGKIGSLYTWGDGYHTLLGHNEKKQAYTPTLVSLTHRVPSDHKNAVMTSIALRRTTQPLKSKFKVVKTGPFHTAMISESNQLYTFGEEAYDKLGHNNNNLIPCKVPGLAGIIIVDAALGLDFTLALSGISYVDYGKVYSWGYGGEHKSLTYSIFFKEEAGALGQGNLYNYSIPTLIPNLEDVKQIEAGYYHALALTSIIY